MRERLKREQLTECKRIAIMKVNSLRKWRGEKTTQRKGCCVLSLGTQKSIQTQQESHHRLRGPQPRETREELSETNRFLGVLFLLFFFFESPSLDVLLKYLAKDLEANSSTPENWALRWLWTCTMQGLADMTLGSPWLMSS